MTNTYLTLTFALAVLAAVVAFAGCGGGEETAQASLTKAQFRKKADFICEGASLEQGDIANEYVAKHPGADKADLVEPAGIPPLEKELRELKELPAPRDLKPQLANFFRAFEEALQRSKEDPSSLLSETHHPFVKANRLGEKYDLGDCAISP
jgi:hypothetical protein